MTAPTTQSWPLIRTAGIDGFLISFADRLSEPANRAALAFRAAIDKAGWSGVAETSTSLVSTYLRFDPAWRSHDQLAHDLRDLLDRTDWYAAAMPEGRHFWRVPTVYGTDLAPQLAEAASMAGLTPAEAIASVSNTRVRVQTIGFAPGQPYLGELPPQWDIPRQTALTQNIPIGALTIAIRQLVLFSVSVPTGWRHIGQTGLHLFQPDAPNPFLLRPGDEAQFTPTTPDALANMAAANGGAVAEPIR